MIFITDRTLSCIDGYDPGTEQIRALAGLLISAGADCIETSERVFSACSDMLAAIPYALRLRDDKTIQSGGVRTTEFIVNDIRDAYTLTRAAELPRVRLRGFDDVMLGGFKADFRYLRGLLVGEPELCPTNAYGMATAAAVEWALTGGRYIVTTFGGVGGFAAFEEVVMALRLARVRKVGRSYPEFPRIRELLESITDERFAPNKPIIGTELFRVKSGIHVDGILKQPKSYLPFPPEDVGRKTEIVLSKHSGGSSVRYKLGQLGISVRKNDEERILALVKSRSESKNGNISDSELIEIVSEGVRA
ncbi:MAG: hypothetical protein LBC28_05705 [Oscillospiraceae bacterium]|jgi:homocitrate synthase NifV|nr:hypothetical protein [Oscillospiraceae bacterium]